MTEKKPKTCGECLSRNGKIYAVGDKIPVPVHPHCYCHVEPIAAIKGGTATLDWQRGADKIFLQGMRNGMPEQGFFFGYETAEYNNSDLRLPAIQGRKWTKVSVNGQEGHFLIASSDGLLFVTYDNMISFYEVYQEEIDENVCAGYDDIRKHDFRFKDGWFVCQTCGFKAPAPISEDAGILSDEDWALMEAFHYLGYGCLEKKPATPEELLLYKYLVDSIQIEMSNIRCKEEYRGKYTLSDKNGYCIRAVQEEIFHKLDTEIVRITGENRSKYDGTDTNWILTIAGILASFVPVTAGIPIIKNVLSPTIISGITYTSQILPPLIALYSIAYNNSATVIDLISLFVYPFGVTNNIVDALYLAALESMASAGNTRYGLLTKDFRLQQGDIYVRVSLISGGMISDKEYDVKSVMNEFCFKNRNLESAKYE